MNYLNTYSKVAYFYTSQISQTFYSFTTTYCGFTMHKMLPEFGLINMNGRMYDPALGRMLSPDNYIPNPRNPQAYNRYSYCLNNPLVYTDPDGEFIQYIIGAVIGGFSSYMMADNLGYKGWDKFWYTLGGAAIGAATAGIGTAVSFSAGVVAGGVVGGAVGGAGFGTMGSYAAGLRGDDLLIAGFSGMWQGAVTGLVGSFVGGAIGGGWGALAGSATAGALGTWMSGGSGEDIFKAAALGGVMGLGVYHASLAYSYHLSGFKSTGLNYNQYAKMIATTQRSIFWNREGKFIPNSRGGINVNALGDRNKTLPCKIPGDYKNALFDYHTHQEFGYDRFSNLQDAIAAGVDPEFTDVTTRQALTLFANRGEIDPMTMYLGTREGHIHYWSHYGVQGTLNYNFSHVFTPYNLLWSLSLIR